MVTCGRMAKRAEADNKMNPSNTLERELAYFQSKRSEWLQHYTGQYALIQRETLVKTFTSFDEAYSAGVEKFGAEPFLVKQIVAQDVEQSTPALFVGTLFACPQ